MAFSIRGCWQAAASHSPQAHHKPSLLTIKPEKKRAKPRDRRHGIIGGRISRESGAIIMDEMQDDAINSRRKFLRMFGVSSAGVALASAAATSKAKIKEGGEDAKAEIEKLQKAYEELDKRSKLILKLVLVLSGLDIFLAL